MNSVWCINRIDRPDRWRDVQLVFDKQGFIPNRFDAVINKVGWKGCRDSHLAIMELEHKEKNDSYAVFEDDIVFLHNSRNVVYGIMEKELPSNVDMLFYGISPQEPLEQYSEHLFRVDKKCWCMHAYTIWNTNRLMDFVLMHRNEIQKIDKWFSERIYPYYNCFVIYPQLVVQVQYPSDTCQRSDVSQIQKNFNRYCIAHG